MEEPIYIFVCMDRVAVRYSQLQRANELGRRLVRAGSQGKDPVINVDLLPNGFFYPKLARDEQDKNLSKIPQQRKWGEEARS
ncbi:hypothetical protein FMUND_5292 [Fusarium mundagurra]|uniref:Uncharacterized protein n=1 Tax=Fusarium mundagurra TaxID=1567541 RepID=A0A8H5YT59_9HYPO|nr:hypothetical protein FMUND_5292 [Fusarium mundagurra]